MKYIITLGVILCKDASIIFLEHLGTATNEGGQLFTLKQT